MTHSPRRQEIAKTLFPQLARVGSALASPARLMLVDLLCQGPRTVEALAEQAGLGVANASQHLQMLRRAQLVVAERDGTFMVYRLASDDVAQFYVSLRALAAKHLAEMDRVMRELVRPSGPPDTASILAKIRAGKVTLVDVRPQEEFDAGHLPGALSMPIDELRGRVDELPKAREVVAYCRGPYCVMAEEAVEVLTEHGFRAQALDLGVVELRARRFRLDATHTPKTRASVRSKRNSTASRRTR